MSKQRLYSWLEANLGGHKLTPPPSTIRALVEVSNGVIQTAFSRHKPLRPSMVADEMRALAKSLRRAAVAADRLSDKAMALIVLASDANRDGTEIEIEPHIHYLEQMATWAERAAAEAEEFSKSLRDHKGGRTPDTRLRLVVTILMDRFQDLLAIRPTHTASPETGLGTSDFELFVKEALRCCAPPEVSFEPRLVDETVIRVLESRDYVPFAPPKSLFKPDA